MQKYINTILTQSGVPLVGASVAVTLTGGSIPVIYSDNGVTPKTNPLTTDGNGAFSFYGADGRYDLSITMTGVTTQTVTDILIEDPADGGAAVITSGSVNGTPIGGSTPSSGAFTTLTASGITALGANLILPKATGSGILVDTAAPTWGWRDLTADIQVRGSGANDPTFATYGATVMRQYSFSATVEQEVFMVFHVPHDYVPGSDIYLHAHWSNGAATPNTGNVIWGFDYAFAKGFNQAAFPAFTTITVTQACPATRYQHNIAETVAVSIAAMEVDGLILVRGYRKAADAADTCSDAVFLHTMDIHYSSTNLSTKGKAPDFYT